MNKTEQAYTAALAALAAAREKVLESTEFLAWIDEVQEIIDDEVSAIELDEIDPDLLIKAYLDNDSADDAHGDLYNLWHD